jgi:hypothetical protein
MNSMKRNMTQFRGLTFLLAAALLSSGTAFADAGNGGSCHNFDRIEKTSEVISNLGQVDIVLETEVTANPYDFSGRTLALNVVLVMSGRQIDSRLVRMAHGNQGNRLSLGFVASRSADRNALFSAAAKINQKIAHLLEKNWDATETLTTFTTFFPCFEKPLISRQQLVRVQSVEGDAALIAQLDKIKAALQEGFEFDAGAVIGMASVKDLKAAFVVDLLQ